MTRANRYPALLLLAGLTACGGDARSPDIELSSDSIGTDMGRGGPGGELQALIQLPADFAPEGIAVAEDDTFYVGSLAPPNLGQILAGDLRTGEFRELVAASGTPALGLKLDERSNLLFVAGGPSGGGHAYDAATGAEVGAFEFTDAGETINDVELTGEAAWFTNSQAPELYRVALGTDGQPGETTTIALPANFGEAGSCDGVPGIMGNGIVSTPDGRYLILIHMSEGQIYRMDTATGAVQPITLSGGDLCSADGLELDGNTLYAVQNFANQIAVVEMGDDFLTGNVTGRITEPFASNAATKVPTTIADAGDALYAVTAGFAEPSPDYVVRVEK